MKRKRKRGVRTIITKAETRGPQGRLSVPYKVYPDLGVINPWSIKTQEDEDNYYKSLLFGCRECDRIEPSIEFMLCHKCTKNGKSKYEQHQQEAFNRMREKENRINSTVDEGKNESKNTKTILNGG